MFLQQANILQDRANFIRQKWARQGREALRVKQTACQVGLQAAQSISPTPLTPQLDLSPPLPHQQQPNQLAKKKRNQKLRLQYKRRAQRFTIEQPPGQEVEHLNVQISTKSVACNEIAGTTSFCWHAAVIRLNDFRDKIPSGYWTIGKRRMGVG